VSVAPVGCGQKAKLNPGTYTCPPPAGMTEGLGA
jgi:hypothetical protein